MDSEPSGMSLGVIGQRCVSEREPELGLGLVAGVEGARIRVRFPGAGEERLYTLGTPVLKRVRRLIPPIGKVDFSVLWASIAIGALLVIVR